MAKELYSFKTTPFKHQEELYFRTRELPRYGVFWEQGCGKTKPMIDMAGHLTLKGKINGLLVLAPNGVHRNWVSDELPAHSNIPYTAFCYHSSKAGRKAHEQGLAELFLTPADRLAVLAMSYDGFMTKAGKDAAHRFLEARRVLYILDEATRIKSPGAKRTKSVLASAKLAEFRRVLTGTPIANGPFDIFTIMKFLNLEFWKAYYLDSYFIFKNHFGIWKKVKPGDTSPFAPAFCVGYRNLEQLSEIISKHSSRVTKDQVLDLPPKLYSKRYFAMNREQLKAYDDLTNEFMTFLQGDLVTAPLVITRLLRLQQVTSGYLPSDLGDPIYMLGDNNPRLQLLEEVIEDVPHKAIIWAKFRLDIDKIMELLGDRAVRYDGKTGTDDRARAIEGFQRGKIQFFVANPAAAGEGLTLHAARTVIYYNNSFKLSDRLQSEDRAHRIGQAHPVNYIDLVAEDTIDENVVKALVKKHDIATRVLGDAVREWLR